EGMQVLEDACATQRKVLGEGSPRTHSTMRRLAKAYRQQDRIEEAMVLLETVYKNLMNDRPGTFQAIQGDLGWTYCEMGKGEQGTELLERAYSWQKSSLSKDHPDTLKSAQHLGDAYLRQGRTAQGMTLLEETFRTQKIRLGKAHEDTL